MNPDRIKALANLLDALRREQEDGDGIFRLGTDDRIALGEAEQIIFSLRLAEVVARAFNVLPSVKTEPAVTGINGE